VALFQEFVDTQLNGRPSLFRIDSVHHMETSFFQALWPINTKYMVISIYVSVYVCNYKKVTSMDLLVSNLIPLNGVGITYFSSYCDKDSAIIFPILYLTILLYHS
jgi:ABC-type microcin C transport system permease subunit YejB